MKSTDRLKILSYYNLIEEGDSFITVNFNKEF